MVRIDKAGHYDAAGGVDLRRASSVQVWPNSKNFLALHQHVGLGEVSDLRIKRHHRTAANDVAAPRSAAARGRVVAGGMTRREEIATPSGDRSRRRPFQEIPSRTEMAMRPYLVAQFAHADVPPSAS